MPYYLIDTNVNNNVLNFSRKPDFTLSSVNLNNSIPMLPSNNLSVIIAILTNISLFYIIKPYILINAIYIITIPLFQA